MSKTFQEYYELMTRALKLQGKQEKTSESYLRTLRRVDARIQKPLDELSPEDLKSYFFELLKTHSWSTVNIDRSSLVFFYTHVLERKWDWIKIVKAPKNKSIPDILTREEVLVVLSLLRKPAYKTCLTSIYSMGLRLSEALQISPADICSASLRLHVRNSKGNKDRFVPMPHATLILLRKYWWSHKNPNLLFPQFKGNASGTQEHMHKTGVQTALKAVLLEAGIHKKLSVHSLRHSYATHLVEIGIHLRMIQELLGHNSPATTAIYTQISKPVMQNSNQMIHRLMRGLSSLL